MLNNLLLFLALVWGCGQALAADGLVPLAPQDREILAQAFSHGIHWTPQVTKSIGGRPVVLGAVLFDGTESDRLNVPDGERETVVGHIFAKLEGNRSLNFIDYYAGVGTQANPIVAKLDAAIGFTLEATVNRALDATLRKIEEARANQPDADIRLLVSGFSRGGAAARHFMNMFEKRWVDERHDGSPPRFYALLFDTVATGQRDNLDLHVPTSADIFYHFVSMDERRLLFPPILDKSLDPDFDRIVTVIIPGAHSDVGGSYLFGVGSEYLVNIDALLSSMGLLPPQCFSAGRDVLAEGKNDSRWRIERWLGIGAPNTEEAPILRKGDFVESKPVPDEHWSPWLARMRELQYTNQQSIPRCLKRNEMKLPEFTITRSGNKFELISLPPIHLPGAKVIQERDQYFLSYAVGGSSLYKVEIHQSVLDRIPNDGSATLSLGVVRNRDGGMQLWWFVNKDRVWQIAPFFYPRSNEVAAPTSG